MSAPVRRDASNTLFMRNLFFILIVRYLVLLLCLYRHWVPETPAPNLCLHVQRVGSQRVQQAGPQSSWGETDISLWGSDNEGCERKAPYPQPASCQSKQPACQKKYCGWHRHGRYITGTHSQGRGFVSLAIRALVAEKETEAPCIVLVIRMLRTGPAPHHR